MSNEVLLLYYEDLLVAELRNIYPHLPTYFADYELVINKAAQHPASGRVLGFVDACLEHCRIHDNGLADEIDSLACLKPFDEIMNSQNWTVQASKKKYRLDGAPLFATDGQVSYNLVEC